MIENKYKLLIENLKDILAKLNYKKNNLEYQINNLIYSLADLEIDLEEIKESIKEQNNLKDEYKIELEKLKLPKILVYICVTAINALAGAFIVFNSGFLNVIIFSIINYFIAALTTGAMTKLNPAYKKIKLLNEELSLLENEKNVKEKELSLSEDKNKTLEDEKKLVDNDIKKLNSYLSDIKNRSTLNNSAIVENVNMSFDADLEVQEILKLVREKF